MKQGLASVEAVLGLAERSVALIDRCRPLNLSRELLRLGQAWRRGSPENPSFVYPSPPDLSELRGVLVRLAESPASEDPPWQWYAERALELELEASLAEAIGTPRFRVLARRRFSAGASAAAAAAAALAGTWARAPLSVVEPERVASDDTRSRHSLINQMLSTIARFELPLSVVVKSELQSAAAVGTDTLYLRPAVWLTPREARRIVVHELLGHALPRVNAKRSRLGLMRVGAKGAADDEEGRALWLEQRYGLMSQRRQHELALRHWAALAVCEGSDHVENVRQLLDQGAGLEQALEIATRAERGAGLAREIVYLPALLRVSAAFEAAPELDAWLGSGRLSLAVAGQLAAGLLGYEPCSVNPELAAGAGLGFESYE